jgi:hypothetical protein
MVAVEPADSLSLTVSELGPFPHLCGVAGMQPEVIAKTHPLDVVGTVIESIEVLVMAHVGAGDFFGQALRFTPPVHDAVHKLIVSSRGL